MSYSSCHLLRFLVHLANSGHTGAIRIATELANEDNPHRLLTMFETELGSNVWHFETA